MAETVPIAEASRRLGVSERTLRRHIAEGTLRGSQIETPQGYRWLVELPESGTLPPRSASSARRAAELPSEDLDTRHAELAELIAALRENSQALRDHAAALRSAPPAPSLPTPKPAALAVRIARALRRLLA